MYICAWLMLRKSGFLLSYCLYVCLLWNYETWHYMYLFQGSILVSTSVANDSKTKVQCFVFLTSSCDIVSLQLDLLPQYYLSFTATGNKNVVESAEDWEIWILSHYVLLLMGNGAFLQAKQYRLCPLGGARIDHNGKFFSTLLRDYIKFIKCVLYV